MANYIIFAASSDIGRATAQILLSAGHSLFVTSRTKENLQPLLTEHSVPFSLCDASNFDAVDEAVKQAISIYGVIDGVVNCAGSLYLKPAHLTTQDQFQAVIDASLTTAFAVVRASAKHLVSTGGSVVLVSSAAAMTGFSNHEAISAAKAGVIGLMQSAAATYSTNKLRFNAVAPGLTETKLTKALTTNSASRKASQDMHALGRLGTAGDIARAIQFFLEPQNDWITGQVLAVDGGLSRVRPKGH